MTRPTGPSTNDTTARRARRTVLAVAVTGTVFIALGAFWLSFASLSDLARRSGIDPDLGWVWPLLVDGVIVIATVSVVALTGTGQGPRAARYPWLLLLTGAGVSVLANASHAVLAVNTRVPAVLAALVAAVPPVVLVAATHLTVQLTRRPSPSDDAGHPPRPITTLSRTDTRAKGMLPARIRPELRDPAADTAQAVREAWRLREQAGWTNRQIAARLRVHPSTIGRWFKTNPPRDWPSPPAVGAADIAAREDEAWHETSKERSSAP